MTTTESDSIETKKTHKRGARGCVFDYKSARGKRWAFTIDNGRYADGRRRQISKKGFERKEDAQEALTNQLKAIHQSAAVAPDEISFERYFRGWLDTQSALSWEPSTEDTNRRRGEYAVREFGHIRLQDLKAPALRQGLIRLKNHGGLHGRALSAKTTRAIGALIKQALRQACDDDVITKNPMDKVKLPAMPEAEVKRPTIEEYDRILERLRPTRGYLMLAVFSADAACRRGEALGLLRSDVDFVSRKVTISKSVQVSKSAGMRIKCTKSGKERVVELSQVTLDMLREHLQMLDKEKQLIGSGYEDNDLVFCTETGAYYSPDRITNRVSEFMREAGCTGLSLHKLRHFGASYLVQQGVPITEVAHRLGHANPEITYRIYARFIPTNRGAAPDVFDGGMGNIVRRHLSGEQPPPAPAKVVIFPVPPASDPAYATKPATKTALSGPKLYKVKG